MRLAPLLPALGLLAFPACGQRLHRTLVEPTALQTVDRKAPFLKAHMRDRTLYVLSPWTADEAGRLVGGTGVHYAVDRTALAQGTFTVPIDSVILFETNVARPGPSVAVFAVIGAITAGAAIYCATNPKACFGSCPTFYVTDGERDVLQAEGFSASVAPALEARDVDALFRARPRGPEVRVHMVNEAYETHVVRYVNLLAVPRESGRRVLSDDAGGFWSVSGPVAPSTCIAPEGDCGTALAAFDGRERTSEADSTDLATREILDLVFDSVPPGSGRAALVLASRQSLLPTYLLYQTIAYMGTRAGAWLAAFERGSPPVGGSAGALFGALGGIDVLTPNGAGGWDSVATVRETGPLASDVRLVPLPDGTHPGRVRLRMARGAWRIDAAGLALMHDRVSPLRIEPSAVLAGAASAPEAHALLVAPDDALVTFPGDRYTLVYPLPDDAGRFELFMESKGYYLEWLREEWLAEEDPARAAALFLDPAGALRRLAPAFKRAEPALEAAFWRSRYGGF